MGKLDGKVCIVTGASAGIGRATAVLFAREFGIRVIQLAGYDVYYEPSTPESLRLFAERNYCDINLILNCG